jgi:hypothetical protein
MNTRIVQIEINNCSKCPNYKWIEEYSGDSDGASVCRKNIKEKVICLHNMVPLIPKWCSLPEKF